MNINGTTSVYGVFGNPIKHTLSPYIHNKLNQIMNKNSVYIPFEINDINIAINGAKNQNIKGLNITVPFKEKVITILDEVDKVAMDIGAVNTIVNKDDKYIGYNTDMLGLYKALCSEGISLKDKNIVIIGAGGAARAVLYMCLLYGAKQIYIINRSIDKALEMSGDIQSKINSSSKVEVIGFDELNKIMTVENIAFQCTSIGLKKDDELLIKDEQFYSAINVGVDLIYNPCVTPFMNKLIERGATVFNGLKMLIYQAVIAYELWNDVDVSEDVINIVYEGLCKKIYNNNYVLIGFMGCGKSYIGKRLSDITGNEFIDMDEFIEDKEGMSINEIFNTKGEEYFRNLETLVLKELLNKENIVLATGGGAVLKKTNAELLSKIGTVYYLKDTPNNIYNRVKSSNDRPLLNCDNPLQKIIEMLDLREQIYENAADYIIQNDNTDWKIEQIIKSKK